MRLLVAVLILVVVIVVFHAATGQSPAYGALSGPGAGGGGAGRPDGFVP